MRYGRRTALGVALLLALVATSPLGESQDHVRDALVVGAGAQVLRGAELYDRACAVCHGDSGLGFAEAKRAFPADHRSCARCHKANNPPVMSLEQVSRQGRDHDLFPIGTPPALRGDGALASLPSAAALFQYTRAAMPRYRPGTMTDREYLDITAFLLHANDQLDGRAVEPLLPDEVGLRD